MGMSWRMPIDTSSQQKCMYQFLFIPYRDVLNSIQLLFFLFAANECFFSAPLIISTLANATYPHTHGILHPWATPSSTQRSTRPSKPLENSNSCNRALTKRNTVWNSIYLFSWPLCGPRTSPWCPLSLER